MNSFRVLLVVGLSFVLGCGASKDSKVNTLEPAKTPPSNARKGPQFSEASEVPNVDAGARCGSKKIEEGEDEVFVDENFSGVKRGSSTKQVRALFGEPESVSGPEEEAATGDTIWSWEYPAQGVSLTMGSSSDDASKAKVSWITLEKPSTIKTALGLSIGSNVEDILSVYKACMSDPDTVPSLAVPSIVIGSHYDGLWIEIADGKVSSMTLGGAE